MNQYQELRDRAFNSLESRIGKRILASNTHLVYHPPVNIEGKNAHFTIYDENSAVCCTEEEALILRKIFSLIYPYLSIEVGSYAGWSTAFILRTLDPEQTLFCVDNFSECNKPELVKQVLQNSLRDYSNAFLFEQDSTNFLNSLVTKADVIFIDGFHRDGKPLLDTMAAVKALKADGYIILHDTWMPDVNKACEWLESEGFNCFTFNTDNRLEIYSKGSLEWINEIV